MSTHPGARPERTVHRAAGGHKAAGDQTPNRSPSGGQTSAAAPEDGATAELAASGSLAAVRQRSLRPGTQLSVVCEHLDASGCGVARCTEDLPQGASRVPRQSLAQPLIHVPNLLPGERAHVKVVHVSSHVNRAAGAELTAGRPLAFAALMHRYDAAPERQIPACGAFGQCGGCTLQHLSYNAQLRFKREQVSQSLAAVLTTPAVHPGLPVSSAGASSAEAQVLVAPCVPSPQPLSYRSRVKLVAASAPAAPGADPATARIILGAYAPRSHRVIDMAGCKVNTPALRALARTLGEQWGARGLSVYDEETGRGALRYVLLREVRSAAVQLSLVVADPPPRAALLEVVAALRTAHPQLASVVLHHNPHPGNSLLASADSTAGPAAADAELGEADEPLLGPDFLYEDLGESSDLRLRVSARSFLQVNRAVTDRLYAEVAAALAVAPGELILDLYCGVGGLGRTLWRRGARLIGIESSASAVADAEHSARAAGLTAQEARFLCGTVEEHLPGLSSAGAAQQATLVLLNPPRRGCTTGVLSAVLACAPRAIAYVSCNPQSLARDLASLTASGYTLTQVTPYDMHPGTPHIETVALLRRT